MLHCNKSNNNRQEHATKEKKDIDKQKHKPKPVEIIRFIKKSSILFFTVYIYSKMYDNRSTWNLVHLHAF